MVDTELRINFTRMDILQYLIELLKIRKEVGIEGLGTLRKKKNPGRYDASTHSFLPPSQSLQFDTEVTENENLVEYIQNKRNISENSAKYFIKEFVDQVNKTLTDEGTYEFNGLGVFNSNNGHLTFNASAENNIGFDFFALPPVAAAAKIDSDHTTAEDLAQDENKEISSSEESDTVISAEENLEEQHHDEAHENLSETISAEQEEQSSADEPTTHSLAHASELDEKPIVNDDLSTTPNETESSEGNSELITVPLVDGAAGTIENPATEATNIEAYDDVEVSATDHSSAIDELNNDAVVDDVVSAEVNSADNVINENLADKNPHKNIEENEATDDEVYDEIAEVNAAHPTEPVDGNKSTTTSNIWDFDDENVISEDDVIEDELPISNADNRPQQATDDHKRIGKKIKISATTKDWDFDSTADDRLVGEEVDDFYANSPQNESDSVPKRPLYQNLLIGILVLAAIGFAVYLYNPEIFENWNNNETIDADQKIAIPIENSQLKTQQDSLSFADSIMQNAAQSGLVVEPAKDTVKVITKTTPVNVTTYEIIGAALANKAEVERYIATMKKNGFNAKVANMPGKIYKKISIASYTSRDSATKELKKLRLRLKNPELYIFEDKNK